VVRIITRNYTTMLNVSEESSDPTIKYEQLTVRCWLFSIYSFKLKGLCSLKTLRCNLFHTIFLLFSLNTSNPNNISFKLNNKVL
jgi:hypothetical protein